MELKQLVLLGLCWITVLLPCISCQTSPPRLLLISVDSMMYDFVEGLPAPNRSSFDYFIQNGVLAKQTLNVFPSSTYPNHYTLLTGLYPESHGLVTNHFYDPDLNEHFDFGIASHNYDSKWYDVGAEPIYVTNTKAGGNRKSGTVLFPTGMARVKGVAPDRMVEDDGTYPPEYTNYEFPYVKMPYSERVDLIIDWFTTKQDPINLGLLYFPEPDELSHTFGPKSDEVKNNVGGPLNDALGYLIDQLKSRDLLRSTNVILTADHGQTTFNKKYVILDDYLDPDSYTLGGSESSVLGLYPKAGKEEEIVRNLTRCLDVEVYRKSGEALRSMNYTRSDRISPVVLAAKVGVVIKTDKASTLKSKTLGLHGYDPVKVPSMRPLFMAMGPGFKKGLNSHMFNSVDIYPLMCHLLDVTPAPNNGSLDNVRHLLATDVNGQGRVAYPKYLLIGGTMVWIALGLQPLL